MSTRDPRVFQIASLASLLVYGIGWLGFDITPLDAAVIVASSLACQYAATRIWSLPFFDPKSALISALSLCLLMRTRSLFLALLVVAITIFGKFLIRYRGKHIYNPTNFGLAVAILCLDGVWVSSGQWGSFALAAFAFVCAGGLVVFRAERSDVTYAFLAAWALLLLSRALYLGDSWRIPLNQLQSGAFLLFAFFMISDPKTTPDSRVGRILFAIVVACGAYYIQFKLFTPNALILSLAAVSTVVPLLDLLAPAKRYQWPGPPVFGPKPAPPVFGPKPAPPTSAPA